MAEERPGGQPTEPPSEKKLRDARHRGEVWKSRDLTSAAVFVAAALALGWASPHLVGQFRDYLRSSMQAAPAMQVTPAAGLELATRMVATLSLPVLGAALLAALVASFLQVGAVFSLHPVRPDLGRLSPRQNLRRVFGGAAGLELLKTLLKVGSVGLVALATLWSRLPGLLATVGRPPEALLGAVGECLAAVALHVGIVAAFLAALDVVHARHAFLKRMRMTRVEVQRELKESEGEPHRKAERRRLHHEILEHQMFEAVAQADCVVINPDHLAVALRHDAESPGAPRVVARGRRLMAAKIREIARQHGIPIIRNVPLARALVELELDQEIPAELYPAVAEVLRFVHRRSDRKRE